MMTVSKILAGLLITSFICHGVETISPSQSLILDACFKTLLRNSEGGYVLHDQKPLCFESISLNNCRSIAHEGHKDRVILYEGMKVWQKFAPYSSNYMICFSSSYISPWNKIHHIIFMNSHLVNEIIHKNLPLFQYVLGPTVNSRSLLETLQKSEIFFQKVLKNNNVLSGILLGFGVNNSLWGSRLENIELAFSGLPENVPYCRKQDLIPSLYEDHKEGFFFYSRNNELSEKVLEPSFGFNNIAEEYALLSAKLELSSEQLTNEPPCFCFGQCEGDSESKKFVCRLEEAQGKIRTFLDKPSFLSGILSIMTGKKFQIVMTPNKMLKIEDDLELRVHETLAQWIWNTIHTGDQAFFKHFVNGLIQPEDIWKAYGNMLTIENKDWVLRAKQNLEESNRLFADFKTDAAFTPISDNIYFRILEQGYGEPLVEPFKASLNYKISDPRGNVLSDSSTPLLIDLKETIPGFAYGVKGMRVGETREIYIHPSMAYGIYTNQEKAIYLRAQVTLEDVSLEKTAFPKQEAADMAFLEKPGFEEWLQEEYNKMAYSWGSRVGGHLAKSENIRMQTLLNELKHLRDTKAKARELTEEEMGVVNKIHWNIYFSDAV